MGKYCTDSECLHSWEWGDNDLNWCPKCGAPSDDEPLEADPQLRELSKLYKQIRGNPDHEESVQEAIDKRRLDLGYKTTHPPTEEVCQCGKEKHGFTRHSDWCPKY